jgi:hypothetical protein
MTLKPRYTLHSKHTLVAHVGEWDLSIERYAPPLCHDWAVDNWAGMQLIRQHPREPIYRPGGMTDEEYATMVAIIQLTEGS